MKTDEMIIIGLSGAVKELLNYTMKAEQIYNDRTGLFTLVRTKNKEPHGYGCAFPDETVIVYLPEYSNEGEKLAQYDNLKQMKNSFFSSEVVWSGWIAKDYWEQSDYSEHTER